MLRAWDAGLGGALRSGSQVTLVIQPLRPLCTGMNTGHSGCTCARVGVLACSERGARLAHGLIVERPTMIALKDAQTHGKSQGKGTREEDARNDQRARQKRRRKALREDDGGPYERTTQGPTEGRLPKDHARYTLACAGQRTLHWHAPRSEGTCRISHRRMRPSMPPAQEPAVIYVYIYVYTYVYMYVCMCVCVYIYIYIYIYGILAQELLYVALHACLGCRLGWALV